MYKLSNATKLLPVNCEFLIFQRIDERAFFVNNGILDLDQIKFSTHFYRNKVLFYLTKFWIFMHPYSIN